MTKTSIAARITGGLLIFGLMVGSVVTQAQQPTPAQTAYIKAETRKAEEGFVAAVAKIVDTRSSVVAKALPEAGRITDPVARMIAGLERSLGKAITDEQKAAIQTADLERQNRVDAANASVRKR